MAFQYWLQAAPPQPARTRFVAIGEAYHGDTLGAIGVGGVDRFTAMFAAAHVRGDPASRRPAARARTPAARRRRSPRRSPALERILDASTPARSPRSSWSRSCRWPAGIYVHPPGFLRGVRELTRAARRAPHPRRGGHRLRPHRHDVRLRAGGRRRPTSSASPRGSRPATCRWRPRSRPSGSGTRSSARMPTGARSSTATPTAAIRSPPRSGWPRSTSFATSGCSTHCRRRSSGSRRTSAGSPGSTTWATCGSAGSSRASTSWPTRPRAALPLAGKAGHARLPRRPEARRTPAAARRHGRAHAAAVDHARRDRPPRGGRRSGHLARRRRETAAPGGAAGDAPRPPRYCTTDLLPSVEPPIGAPSGSGRPAVGMPSRWSSSRIWR